MNLGRARVVLRPRGAADLLDLAALVCVRDLRLHAPLALALALPPALAGYLAHARAGWSAPTIWLLSAALAGLLHAPVTVAVGELLFAPPRARRVPAVLATTLRRAPALLLAHLAVRLGLLLSSVLLVPLPWFASRTAFVHEAILLERASPAQALRRSARLSRARGGGLALWLGLLSAPLAFLIGAELLAGTLLDDVLQLGRPGGELPRDGISFPALLGFFLSVAYTATARFLGYVDARTRSEGWDLQLRLTELAARALREPGAHGRTSGTRDRAREVAST